MVDKLLLVTSLLGLLGSAQSFSRPTNTFKVRSSLKRSSVDSPIVLASSTSTVTSDLIGKGESYLRWNKVGNTWKMETAVTSFRRGNTIVDLHSQLHFGDKAYFDFYNEPAFSEPLDHVLYELLVDDSLLEYNDKKWKVKEAIMASPNDQSLANAYGWACQASQVDYTHPKWIHADLSRQEFLKLLDDDNDMSSRSNSASEPLWKLASSPSNPLASSAAAEAVSALLNGPPQLSYYATGALKRRLFTNLFLPGSQLANTLRAIFWLAVPSPELSVILLDWSSLLNTGAKSKRTSGVATKSKVTSPSALSEVALPILTSLVKLDVASIRRFLFGQVLLSSDSKATSTDQDQAWSLLVTQRNDNALRVLKQTIKNHNEKSTTTTENTEVHTALLYGSSHCPDLHSKLVADGYKPVKTTWRTAWSVQENEGDTILPALSAALVLYLVVGALDWVGMMGDVSEGWVSHEYLDAGVAAALYLVRHVLLYLGMSKFLVDWTNSND